jgi:hypothetical protein
MKKSSIFPRFLLSGVVGSLLVLLAIPWLRVGAIQLVLRLSEHHMSAGVPGPALARLLQVDEWSAQYPHFFLPVQRGKVLCYASLQEMETALQIGAQALSGPTLPEDATSDIWDKLLIYPNIAANWLLKKRYPEPLYAATMPLQFLAEACRDRDDQASMARIRQLLDGAGSGATNPALAGGDGTTTPPPTGEPDPPIRRRPVNQNAEWGVTKNGNVRAYSLAGKFLGRIPAGTLLDVGEARQTKAGYLADCSPGTPIAGMPTRILIRSDDLMTWRGALEDVSQQERQLRARQANIEATIKARTKTLAELHEKRNPSRQTYESALAEYRGLYKRSEELKKIRDAETGIKRQEAANELKQMKGKVAAVSRRYEAAKLDYEAWKRNNPPASAGEDGTIRRLQQERDAIDTQIRRLDV